MQRKLMILVPVLALIPGCGGKTADQEGIGKPSEIAAEQAASTEVPATASDEPDLKLHTPVGID